MLFFLLLGVYLLSGECNYSPGGVFTFWSCYFCLPAEGSAVRGSEFRRTSGCVVVISPGNMLHYAFSDCFGCSFLLSSVTSSNILFLLASRRLGCCNCLQRCKVVLPFFQNMHRAPPSQGVRPGARRAPIMTFEPSCAFSRASTAGRPGSPSSAGPSPCPGRSAARTSMREANSGWGAPRERRFLLISLLISWSLTGAAVGH